MEARLYRRRAIGAATAIQAAWRGHTARAVAAQLRQERAATRLQATWRMHRQRAAYQLHRRFVLSWWWLRPGSSGMLAAALVLPRLTPHPARCLWCRRSRAATTIQSYIRMRQQRRRFIRWVWRVRGRSRDYARPAL